MQRVVSIHLNGSVYQLEENGYNALFAYLDSTEARLKDHPDRAQLLADLERAIAETCQAYLGSQKTVITTADVAQIIAEQAGGQAASSAPAASTPAAGSSSQSSSGANSSAAGANTKGANTTGTNTTGPNTGAGASSQAGYAAPYHRRLWQIREGGMIAGVCLGLATFFRIDVTLVRVLFAIFALVTGGWGIVVYLVLMFLLPRAQNVAEAEAPLSTSAPYKWPWDEHGWPWDKGWPWDRPGSPWPRPPQPPGSPASAVSPVSMTRDERHEWREQRREWRDQWRAARMAAYPPPSTGSAIVIAVFVLAAFGWLTFWMRSGWFWGGPIFWGGPFYGGRHSWISIIFLLVFLRFLMWPLGAWRWGWYGHPGYGLYPRSPWGALWHATIWIATLLFLIWIAGQIFPGFHELIQLFQTHWPSGRFDV